jgi:hypothetical protein
MKAANGTTPFADYTLRFPTDDHNNYQERVDVIGKRKFIVVVEQLEREDLQLKEIEIGKDKVCIVTIEPAAEKMDRDIRLPQLSPILEFPCSWYGPPHSKELQWGRFFPSRIPCCWIERCEIMVLPHLGARTS